MNIIPDVLGMKMPAAAKLLDAAGISYIEKKLKPLKDESVSGHPLRVIRQNNLSEKTTELFVCSVPDIKTE